MTGPAPEVRVSKSMRKQPGTSGKLHRTGSGEWVWSSDDDEQEGSDKPRTQRRHSSATISSSELPGPITEPFLPPTIAEGKSGSDLSQEQSTATETKSKDNETSASSNIDGFSPAPLSNATVNLVLRMRYVHKEYF